MGVRSGKQGFVESELPCLLDMVEGNSMYRQCKGLYGAPVALVIRFPRVCVYVRVCVCAGFEETFKEEKCKCSHPKIVNQSINRQKPQTPTPSASPCHPCFSEEPPPDHSSSNPSSSANSPSCPTSPAPVERRPMSCADTAASSPPNATAPAAATPPKAADIDHCVPPDRGATDACGTDYIAPST